MMPEDDEAGPLSSLDARLAEARAAREKRSSEGKPRDKGLDGFVGAAFRIGTELIAAVAVAMLIGWGLDQWLNTAPWLMIVFFFLGAVAGILNVIRTANRITG